MSGKKICHQRFGEKKFSPKPNYYSPRLLNSPHQLTHTSPHNSQMNISKNADKIITFKYATDAFGKLNLYLFL